MEKFNNTIPIVGFTPSLVKMTPLNCACHGCAKVTSMANLKNAQRLVITIKVKDQSFDNPVKFLVAV